MKILLFPQTIPFLVNATSEPQPDGSLAISLSPGVYVSVQPNGRVETRTQQPGQPSVIGAYEKALRVGPNIVRYSPKGYDYYMFLQALEEEIPINPPAPVPDIDFSRVIVIESNPLVLFFPQRASLDKIEFRKNEMEIQSSGTYTWPMVPVSLGDEPSQAATLWVFLHINGVWYATGAERLRPQQLHGVKPEEGSPELLIGSWLSDENRWKVMANYNPKPGEWVGLMVVAGSTRSDYNVPLESRSNVVLIQWPGL